MVIYPSKNCRAVLRNPSRNFGIVVRYTFRCSGVVVNILDLGIRDMFGLSLQNSTLVFSPAITCLQTGPQCSGCLVPTAHRMLCRVPRYVDLRCLCKVVAGGSNMPLQQQPVSHIPSRILYIMSRVFHQGVTQGQLRLVSFDCSYQIAHSNPYAETIC